MGTKPKIGIVAGAGHLPRRLVDQCLVDGRSFFVFAIEGHASQTDFQDVPHAWIKLGRTGDSIALAQREGVEEIVMAGAVRRPSFTSLLPDATTLKILGKVGGVAFSGDDGLLRAVIRFLEDAAGLKVVGVDQSLDDLVPELGVLTSCIPDQHSWRDIERGRGILDLFSAADVGQSVVIQESLVLGIEAIEGTDGLLSRCGDLRRRGPGGVLVKMRKRGQERRVDLPTIGVTTVKNAAEAGLRGIAIEAGGSLIVDREDTVAAAEDAGLFIVAVGADVDGPLSSDTVAAGITRHGAKQQSLKVYIIAGEESGDALGGRLMQALHNGVSGGIEFRGVGGASMAAQGLNSLFDMSEISLMGLVEILPHIPNLRRRIRQTAEDIASVKPDVLITIDAPGFCKRVVDVLPPAVECPKIHYVAPTVWAWRPGRVHGFKRRFDMLLTLLPFEPRYFHEVGMEAAFVGHSVLESGADAGDGKRFREKHDIPPDDPVICILPGSRPGEVSKLLDCFIETALRVRQSHPTARFVVPTVPALAETVRDGFRRHGLEAYFVSDEAEKFDAMAASNAAIAASGTVALELALERVPTVIAYRVSWLTYEIVRRLIKVKFVHLLNYLAGEAIVPERLQADCTPDRLTTDIELLLGPAGEEQTAALEVPLKQLSPGAGTAPSTAAAEAVLSKLGLTSKAC